MPRTIEHKIKLLDRPATPPTSPTDSVTVDFGGPLEYGTIQRREYQPNNFPSLRRTAPAPVEEGAVEKEEEPKRDYWPKMGNGQSNGRSQQSSHNSTQMSRSDVAPEKPARKYHHYESKQQDDEVTYGTETFERNLRYSPHEIERQHFSSRSFGEQRSLGGDGESRASVRFEDDHPTRPIDPNYDNPNPFAHRTHRSNSDEDDGGGGDREGVRLLHRSKHLDTLPLRIPRPKLNGGAPPPTPIHSNKRNDNVHSPQIHDQYSQRPVRVLPPPLSFTNSNSSQTHSPNSPNRHSRQSWHTKTQQNSPSSGIGQSPSEATKSSSPESGGMKLNERRDKAEGDFGVPPNLPMKKVIRKSRWVSIHDGKPMSQFVETVHYEPVYGTTAGTHYGHSPSHNSMLHRCPATAELWSSSSSCSLSSVENEAEIGNNDKKWTKKNSKRLNRHENSTTKKSDGRSQTLKSSKSTIYVTQNPVYSIAL